MENTTSEYDTFFQFLDNNLHREFDEVPFKRVLYEFKKSKEFQKMTTYEKKKHDRRVLWKAIVNNPLWKEYIWDREQPYDDGSVIIGWKLRYPDEYHRFRQFVEENVIEDNKNTLVSLQFLFMKFRTSEGYAGMSKEDKIRYRLCDFERMMMEDTQWSKYLYYFSFMGTVLKGWKLKDA
jgi:hypothetical protein